MRVAALGVGLPHLDQRITHRRVLAIKDTPAQGDTLTGHIRRGDLGDRQWSEADAQERPDSLRRGGMQAHCAPPSCSIGVASRPRRTMSKWYPSAYAGEVSSQSSCEISRCRARSSGTLL